MVRNMDVLCIIALHLQFSWQNACNNRCNGFLLSMSPLTHHTHQQSVCVLSHHWCHINSYLMQLFSLFLMKSIVFAILLCHICSDTYSDREGRYSRCFQMIAKITSLKGDSLICFFFKAPLKDYDHCQDIQNHIFQSSVKWRGCWGMLQRADGN